MMASLLISSYQVYIATNILFPGHADQVTGEKSQQDTITIPVCKFICESIGYGTRHIHSYFFSLLLSLIRFNVVNTGWQCLR